MHIPQHSAAAEGTVGTMTAVRDGVDPLKRYEEEEAMSETRRPDAGFRMAEEMSRVPMIARENTGYESPDEQHPTVREPHRIKSCPATVPHRRRHARKEILEGQEPENRSHASLNDLVLGASKMRKVGIRDRIACIQWTWFTMTMVYLRRVA